MVQALRDVSLRLGRGDRLGLVGGNGAGKTTLLRTMAGIYEPVVGRVQVDGVVTAMLDPNLGMNMELTGRENIMLRGLYNGYSRAQTGCSRRTSRRSRRSASSWTCRCGSTARAWSCGWLRDGHRGEPGGAADGRVVPGGRRGLPGQGAGAAGKRGARADILVLSSHQPAIMMEWCTRVIWMDHGRVREDGAPAEVLSHYLGHPVEAPAATVEA